MKHLLSCLIFIKLPRLCSKIRNFTRSRRFARLTLLFIISPGTIYINFATNTPEETSLRHDMFLNCRGEVRGVLLGQRVQGAYETNDTFSRHVRLWQLQMHI